jgi:hypothetical protein
MITISLDGAIDLNNKLAVIPSGVTRRRILRTIAARVQQNSKNRTRAQLDLDGLPFAPHKQGRRRKMLARLGNRLKVVSATDHDAIVGFASPVESSIAAKQQFGHTETFDKNQFKDKSPLNAKDPATRRQAKALIEVGYKIKRAKGRGYKTPSIQWIVANLNIGKAGVILRVLRGRKDSWKTTLPPRSFLGVPDAELAELTDLAIQEVTKALED